MPIFAISSRVTAFALSKSNSLSGPNLRTGSRPIQKFRVTDMRGIIARSWYTVATPASIASRGLEKVTSSPSIRILPLVGLWTPDIVLMKVDLPAPLSPGRQWHSPGRTETETPARAMTGPKCFWMSMSSIRGLVISTLSRDHASDVGVQNDGHQKDDAKEHAEE